jgi:predicted nucleic acid-binding protein
MAGSFFDTNVLIYLASDDAAKADRAEALVASGGAISVQVLNECANVARRKMRLSWSETREMLGAFTDLLTVFPLTLEIHRAGLALAARYGLSVYDAMIAASAVDACCDTLWSEDLRHGMMIGEGLRIIDPFRGAP